MRFLFLPHAHASSEAEAVQLSALRIVLVAGCILEGSIAVHSAWIAIERGLYYIVWIVLLFYAALVWTILVSARNRRLGTSLLIGVVYAAGFFISACVRIPEIARLGFVFCYVAPLLAGLLHGYRLALLLMAFNLLPFGMAVSGYVPPNLFGIDATLEYSHAYIHSLTFVFLNCCLPLAAFRVLHSAQDSALRLGAANEMWEELFQHNGAVTLVCDSAGRVLRANAKALAIFAYDDESAFAGEHLHRLLIGVHSGKMATALAEAHEGSEWRVARGDRSRQVQVQRCRATSAQRMVLTLNDVTELRRAQAQLSSSQARERFLSQHDADTGLPNRESLYRWMSDALSRTPEGHVRPVLTLRLGALRQINARFGIAAGDKAISAYGQLLRKAAGDNACVARIRGVVFAVAMPACASADEALRAVERLRAALPAELSLGEDRIRVESSAGVAFYPADGVDAGELVRCSEAAMDTARRRGLAAVSVFDAEGAARLARRVAVEVALASAIEGREFALVYQPKFNTAGKLLGFEALLRWHSARLGKVSPAEFIPIAEEAGLVGRLSAFVLDEACRQISDWRRAGYDVPRVAVNLSERDLERDDLFESVLAAVARHSVPPGALEIEVTETFFSTQPEQTLRQLRMLKDWSFRIAIDDFGAGYSSLAKLAELPLSVLKIDRAFLLDLERDPRRERVVRSIVSLAHSLELEVIAEGVETLEQLAVLESLGCHGYQGFLFAAPAAPSAWAELLRGGQRPLAERVELSALPA